MRCRWPTSAASTATYARCHNSKPLATTLILRPTMAGTSRIKSRRATLVATRAPASPGSSLGGRQWWRRGRQPRSRCRLLPARCVGTRSPNAFRTPPRAQRRGVSGSASSSRRGKTTRNSSFGPPLRRSQPCGHMRRFPWRPARWPGNSGYNSCFCLPLATVEPKRI